MALKALGGKTRKFLNTETGEILSRRQADKIRLGIESYEKKAKENRAKNLALALSRPARGRLKASDSGTVELRLQAEQIKLQQKAQKKLEEKIAKGSKPKSVKKITPNLLKTGKRARRIPFWDYEQFENLLEEMKAVKNNFNGRRLVSSYAIGVHGFDERDQKPLSQLITGLQSPLVVITEDDFDEMIEDFRQEKLYFIPDHFFLHLHFDDEYAENRHKKAQEKIKKEQLKNIPEIHRKKKRT